MEKNEKIVAIAATAIVVGSATLFAVASKKAKSRAKIIEQKIADAASAVTSKIPANN